MYLSLISKINEISFSRLDLFHLTQLDKKNLPEDLSLKLGNMVEPLRKIEKSLLDIRPFSNEDIKKFIDNFRNSTDDIVNSFEEVLPIIKDHLTLGKNPTKDQRDKLEKIESKCDQLRVNIYNYIKIVNIDIHDLISKELENDKK